MTSERADGRRDGWFLKALIGRRRPSGSDEVNTPAPFPTQTEFRPQPCFSVGIATLLRRGLAPHPEFPAHGALDSIPHSFLQNLLHRLVCSGQ